MPRQGCAGVAPAKAPGLPREGCPAISPRCFVVLLYEGRPCAVVPRQGCGLWWPLPAGPFQGSPRQGAPPGLPPARARVAPSCPHQSCPGCFFYSCPIALAASPPGCPHQGCRPPPGLPRLLPAFAPPRVALRVALARVAPNGRGCPTRLPCQAGLPLLGLPPPRSPPGLPPRQGCPRQGTRVAPQGLPFSRAAGCSTGLPPVSRGLPPPGLPKVAQGWPKGGRQP